jgi:hypothetical protein
LHFAGFGAVPIEDAEQGEEHLKQQLTRFSCDCSPVSCLSAQQSNRTLAMLLLRAHAGASSCSPDHVAAIMPLAEGADVAVGRPGLDNLS